MTPFSVLLSTSRGRAHLSRRELATRAGVAAPYLQRLESGAHHPSREIVEALADAMSLDGYTRALLLTEAGFVPLTDEPFRQLVATVAGFWARKNLTETDLLTEVGTGA